MIEKIMQSFNCGYCGHVFNKKVGTTGGGVDKQGRRITKISDQVKCPKCTNFLKTWSDKE